MSGYVRLRPVICSKSAAKNLLMVAIDVRRGLKAERLTPIVASSEPSYDSVAIMPCKCGNLMVIFIATRSPRFCKLSPSRFRSGGECPHFVTPGRGTGAAGVTFQKWYIQRATNPTSVDETEMGGHLL